MTLIVWGGTISTGSAERKPVSRRSRSFAFFRGERMPADIIAGVAASVRVATLPGELRAKDGDGVREVLAMTDGETLLQQTIADAKPWQPTKDDETTPEDGGDDWTNIKFDKGRTDRANLRRLLKQFRDRVRFCGAGMA